MRLILLILSALEASTLEPCVVHEARAYERAGDVQTR